MALHILPQESGFGEALGSGIGAGLQALAQMKLNQITKRAEYGETQKLLEGLGVPSPVAKFAAAQTPQNQALIFQNLPGIMQQFSQQQSGRAAQAGGLSTDNAIQQANIAQAPTGGGPTAQPATPLQSLQGLPKTGADLITHPLTSDAIRNAMSRLNLGEEAGKQVGKPGQDEALQEAFSRALQPQQAAPQEGPPVPAAGVAPQQAPTSPAASADILKDLFTSPEERRKQREEEREERKLAQKEKSSRWQAQEKNIKEIYDKTQAAKKDLRGLNQLQELNETGDLDEPDLVEFLQRTGLDVSALLKPDSVQFQAIATQFISNAKEYFGSRVTNFDLEQFLKTIPTLSQTREGRKRIIAGLKQLKQGEMAYMEVAREIIDDNDGSPPDDFLFQISDRVDAKLDKIAEKFKEDLKRPVPKSKVSPLTTGVAAAAGSLIGAPGSILKALAGRAAGGGASH